jgi:hypothetical protein
MQFDQLRRREFISLLVGTAKRRLDIDPHPAACPQALAGKLAAAKLGVKQATGRRIRRAAPAI